MESSKAGSEGSSALLQAVLRLTEESEFRQQFRGLSEALSARRGETVATLSAIVSRMREQLKLKKEMEPLLEKAQDAWREMMQANEKLMAEVRRLGKENEELSKKVKVLEGQVAEQEEKSRVNEEVNLDSNQQRNRKRTRDNISKSRLDASFSFATAMSMSMAQTTNDEEAEANGREEGEDLDAGLESQLADSSVYSPENFVPLTHNPYDSLNPEYYNPTQFFQRVSTTTVGRRGRGKRGGATSSTRGGRKSAAASGKEKSKSKKRARKTEHLEPAIEIVYEACGDSRGGNQVVLKEGEGKEDVGSSDFPETRGEVSNYGASSDDGENTGHFDFHTPPSYFEEEAITE